MKRILFHPMILDEFVNFESLLVTCSALYEDMIIIMKDMEYIISYIVVEKGMIFM